MNALYITLAIALTWVLSAKIYETDMVRSLKDRGEYSLKFNDCILKTEDINESICIVRVDDE